MAEWMPDQSTEQSEDTASPEVYYHERFHLKFLLTHAKLPIALIAVSIIGAWLFTLEFDSESLAPTPVAENETAAENVVSEVVVNTVEVIVATLTEAVRLIFDGIALPDLNWMRWGLVFWWVLVLWSVLRAWFRWFRSYAEVSSEGFTIYTPKSFWFGLGTKGNRMVPAAMIFDADEASSIIDNTVFMKTVSRVNVFVRDTAGDEDAVIVAYARRADTLIRAIKRLAQANMPSS